MDCAQRGRIQAAKEMVEETTAARARLYFAGTRRFSSSSKCWMTTICAGAPVVSLTAALSIRNRWPSATMSYTRVRFRGVPAI
jgi:hypothetical protein